MIFADSKYAVVSDRRGIKMYAPFVHYFISASQNCSQVEYLKPMGYKMLTQEVFGLPTRVESILSEETINYHDNNSF